jgi:tetratricopeptide (TPR) repeat protein
MARQIVDRFADKPADDSNWRRELVFIHSKIGDTHKIAGDLKMARQHYDLALSIIERLVHTDPPPKKDPLKTDARHFLSATLNRIGQVLFDQGDFEAALTRYQEAMAISQKVADSEPGPYRNITLAVRHSRLGAVLLKLKRPKEALPHFNSALEIRVKLVAIDHTESSYADYLASSRGDMGGVYRELKKLDESVEHYEAAVAIRRQLAKNDPTNLVWEASLRNVQEKLDDAMADRQVERANTLVADGKLKEAIQEYRKALEISERLAAKGQRETVWQARLQDVQKGLEAALARQTALAGQDRPGEPRFELSGQ